ncbi:MAG TPA: hypothetical protein DD706_12285 [Nitrospiraceae bacterium]|nr:hypothetical protein [Nitrospiraceae bacterium]
MTRLTTKQRSFILLMTKSDEHARRGFDLILERPGFEKFFGALAEAGLFDPIHNSAPVPAGEPGFVRIPYWDALNYLEAVAKVSGEKDDLQLADKVMTVVRTVSQASELNQTIRDNYHTNRKFADILGLVPTAAVTEANLDLIPGWLEGKFDRGMVGHALDRGVMRRLLASDLPDDWDKACVILRHCTSIVWIAEQALEEDTKKPVTVVEDHRLKKLINNHAKYLGKLVGKKAAEIFVERIEETFDQGRRNSTSWAYRPAIEDHAQNHEWYGPENRFVEGLRDVLLNWVDHDLFAAKPFINKCLIHEVEIIRRIGIHVLDQRWDKLGELLTPIISPQLFDAGHIHELYGLLRHHFEKFTEIEKAATVEAIRHLSGLDQTDGEQRLKHIQRNWLSAIEGKGYEPADSWFNSLNSDQSLGLVSEHPDFLLYMESWTGPGPSHYQIKEIIAFAEDASIIDKLNAFHQQGSWRAPSTRALVATLEEAVALAPQIFLRLLQDFQNAKRPFQYGIIVGFKRLWDTPGETPSPVDWDKAWPELVRFFEQLVEPPEFWTEQSVEDQDLTPNRDWIPPIIAEFLRSGTKNDKKAYSPDLLPRTWALLTILLEKLEWQDEAPRSNAMTQAINSSRGKAIEAVISQALRDCRLSDRDRHEHIDVWSQMRPIFDAEIAKCKNANYEFSTLTGAYLANLDYIDRDWLHANIELIFPTEFTNNFICALGGLMYAKMTPPIYALLVGKGVIDRALHQQLEDKRVEERLVKQIALAYLWGLEELDSTRFAYFFETEQVEYLGDAAGLFWSFRDQQLTSQQIAQILLFWERCLLWSNRDKEPHKRLLSKLSLLSCYLTSITERERNWLVAVAPYINVSYNDDFFLEELDRLADAYAADVSIVLKAFLDSYVPYHDFGDRLTSILTKLAQHGQRNDAMAFAEKLRLIPGMIQLYEMLTRGTGGDER